MNISQSPSKRFTLFWRIHDIVLNVTTASMLVGILLMMVFQIVTRYFFNNPLNWTEEITRLFQVWLTFLGGVVMVRDKASICIDAITNLFPKKVQKFMYLFCTALSIIFLVILLIYSIRFVNMNLHTYSLVIYLNMAFVFSIIPVSAVLMIINILRVVKEAPEWEY